MRKQTTNRATDALRLIETHNHMCDYVTKRAANMPVWSADGQSETERAMEALRGGVDALLTLARAAGINAVTDDDRILPYIRIAPMGAER